MTNNDTLTPGKIAELFKEAIYLPHNIMTDNHLQTGIAICNLIQDLGRSGIETLNDDTQLQEMFNNLLGAITTYPYLPEEQREQFNMFIEQEKNTLLNNQNLVDNDTLNSHLSNNLNFTNTYWEDLEIWKNYDIINDLNNNLAIGFHNDNYAQQADQQNLFFAETMGGMNPILSTCNSIAKEDTTCFLMSLIFLNKEHKEELDTHYKENIAQDRGDKQRYVDRLWDNITIRMDEFNS